MGKSKRTSKTFAKYILNCLPSRDTGNDWLIESAEAAGLLAAAPIPASKDLRESWWVVGDQEETGSCVGWASADAVLRWHFVKANRLPGTEPLSTRYIWMAAKETDAFVSRPTTFIESDGTSLKAALDVARKFGVVLIPIRNQISADCSSVYGTVAEVSGDGWIPTDNRRDPFLAGVAS